MKSTLRRYIAELSGFTLMRAAAIIDIGALLAIIALITYNAWPALSWEFE